MNDNNVLLVRGIDLDNRTLILNGGIDEDLFAMFSLGMHLIDPSKGPFTIKLSTPGGDVECGLAMYDAINEFRQNATILVQGYAHSMGAIILQAASKRLCTANGVIMAHWGYQGLEDTNQENFKKKLKYNARLDDTCNSVLLERMRERNPKTTLAAVVKKTESDWYMTPVEAIAAGLLDGVLGSSAILDKKRKGAR